MPLWAAALCACAPALDWRQVKLTELGLEAQFPCRPAGHARDVWLAGQRRPMVMHGCAADGSTFAVGSLQLGDVREVAGALDALLDAAAQNLQAPASRPQPHAIAGMTPNEHAGRVDYSGRRPDGTAVELHLVVFARGARVYQASVVGSRPAETAVQSFLGELRLVDS